MSLNPPSVPRARAASCWRGLAFVPPGVGKTHLAIALGIKAVEAGYPVLFLTLEELTPAVGAGVKGESYRLKEKRRAGLLGGTGSPVPAEKEVEVQP